MRLDFNILWVEDNQTYVVSQQEKITQLLRKEGFKLCVKFAKSVDDASTYLSDEIYKDHIDLILMDYDLGAGKMGDEGLVEVRRLMPFRDIVFYSGVATTQLDQKVADQRIQGVYSTYRTELPDTVYGVFENLVHKVLDIDHSRGIVMGATSEIDEIINQSLIKLFGQFTGDGNDKCLAIIAKRLEEKKKEFEKSFLALQQLTELSQLGEHHGMYTSEDRLRLLRKTLSILAKGQPYDSQILTYQNDIAPKRNLLAHVRVVKDGFSRKLFDKNGNELTADEMRKLRVLLLEFQEFFDGLLANV